MSFQKHHIEACNNEMGYSVFDVHKIISILISILINLLLM
jgi:hypothetical protein